MSAKNKIESVRIETVHDEIPDLSYWGEFTDEARSEAFIRWGDHAGKQIKELGEDDELPNKGREYRFFLPAMTGDETGNPDSPRQDWQRMEAFLTGEWCMVGIIAKAVVITPNGITQTLRSGGLWGIESDSDKAYIDEIKAEQLNALRAELESFGFGKRAIDYAFAHKLTDSD